MSGTLPVGHGLEIDQHVDVAPVASGSPGDAAEYPNVERAV